MDRGTLRLGVTLPVALALLTPAAHADLLIQTGPDALAGHRQAQEGEPAEVREAVAAALVLFFPPLSAQNNPDPPNSPEDPPGPPGEGIDPPPEEPPHDNPEPASLVMGTVGGGLVWWFGWRRRRSQPALSAAA